jgi:hypothetical protein
MADKLHPVVELMLARMETHPEEFPETFTGGRWYTVITRILNWSSEEESEVLRERLRDIMLDKAHAEAMDELLNGEERRTGTDMETVRISRFGSSAGIAAAALPLSTIGQISIEQKRKLKALAERDALGRFTGGKK